MMMKKTWRMKKGRKDRERGMKRKKGKEIDDDEEDIKGWRKERKEGGKEGGKAG